MTGEPIVRDHAVAMRKPYAVITSSAWLAGDTLR